MYSNPLFLVLYEISMSIGNSLDLEKMLGQAVTAMLSRLNCSSAAIYRYHESGPELIYVRPKVVTRNPTHSAIFEALAHPHIQGGWRMVSTEVGGQYYYLFELKNFGYFMLSKSNGPLEALLLNAMPKINLKLVTAIKACHDNRNLKRSRERLAEAQQIARLGSWSITVDPLKIVWDDEMYRVLGAEPRSFVPTYRQIVRFLPKGEHSRAREMFLSLVRTNQVDYEGVFEVQTAMGKTGFVQIRSRPLYDTSGRLIKLVGTMLDMTKQHQLERRLKSHRDALQHQAYHDALTGLPNRLLFLDRLEHAIASSQHGEEKVAVLFIDLDRFKEINDSLGHAFGDEVIKEVALRLERGVHHADTIARFGGDEFVMMFTEIEGTVALAEITRTILEVMAEPFGIGEHLLYITLSIGISVFPDDAENASSLLKNADAAMYQAKEDGRNTFQFYTRDMTEKAFERLMLENSLRESIEKEHFLLYYQPLFDGESGDIIAMEALLRWDHPGSGVISPERFVPILEETGMIIPLGGWVMRQAMAQIKAWHDAGIAPGPLAINLSIKQLNEMDFYAKVRDLLEETECRPEWLIFELTEGEIMLRPEATSRLLEQFSGLGIEIAVDDFGTGYSSLSYLKRLPIDRLKIDRSFICDVPDNEEDVAIVNAVVALASALGLKVIAEGVETEAQRAFLVANGCINHQGFLYSRPLPQAQMELMLLRRSRPN